eukprot:12663942-Alexandrium_andersonii.AAC.1
MPDADRFAYVAGELLGAFADLYSRFDIRQQSGIMPLLDLLRPEVSSGAKVRATEDFLHAN